MIDDANRHAFHQGQSKHSCQTAGRVPALKLVSETYSRKDQGSHGGCTAYLDFRRMLEKEKNLDAVLVATPDHVHAVAAMAAIQSGKHVYCEKVLCHSVYEVRQLTEAARNAKVATQMGNHGHSGEGIRPKYREGWSL